MAQPPTISKGWFTANVPYFLGWHWEGWVFSPINPYGIFFKTPRHFRRFSFPLWLGGIYCTALCEFGLATYGWCCSGKVGGEALELEKEEVLQGNIQAKLPPSWAGQPTPKEGTSLRNKGLIAGLMKGNQWSISGPYFWGVYLRRGRLTGHETTLEPTKITWVGPERHKGQWPNS